MEEPLDAWFAREVLVHEAPLVRYLTTWPAKDEIHELRQETYIRVYEAAAKERPRSAKSFLIATARDLLIDRKRRQGMASFEPGWGVEEPDVLVDEISLNRSLGAEGEARALTQALESLPPDSREIVSMRRVEELSHKEMAARLGIGEAIVEKQVAKAMRGLADALFGCQCGEEPHAAGARPVGEDRSAQEQTNRRDRRELVGAAGWTEGESS
jgi:RNA polymerase sigma-70 factor (ECF subfamily)